jgi:hypothetical protein
MKKANIVVIVLVGVLILCFCVSGVLLFRGISQFSKEEKTLNRAKKTLDNYYARNPFPSSENEANEKRNGEVLRRWLTGLSDSLREGQIPPVHRTPSQFVLLFRQKRKDLETLADSQKVQLPVDFAYGFDRYAGDGSLPDPPNVPRLVQQLMIVEQLCDVLFQAGAAGLTKIRREEFDSAGGGTGAGSGSGARSPRRPRRGSAAVAASGGDRSWRVTQNAGELKRDALHARLRFGLTFDAREAALARVLNALAAHDMFAVVTLIHVEKSVDDVTQPTAQRDDSLTDLMLQNMEHPPRSQRLMSGDLLEQPMRVTMEVDVYRFAELTSGRGA